MMDIRAEIRPVLLDGILTWKLKCPTCGTLGLLDDDQFYGRVSTQCALCAFHETVNWSQYVLSEKGQD